MDIPIVFEDDSLVVIDKPSGLVVNRAESVKGETLQDWIEKKFQISNFKFQKLGESDFIRRSGIVHRLDKETSGLLIIAKTPQAFVNLQLQFKEREVVKKYTAIVHGKVTPAEGEIKADIGRLPWNRERFGILPGAKSAHTSYKVISIYEKDKNFFSLLLVTPYTGRTHQIRVHLKYLGHPIVADNFYVGRKTYRSDIKFCPRIFLHASFLRFKHPETEQYTEFRSELPKDLKEVIGKLKKI